MTHPDRSDRLLAGRRAIDGIPGVEILQDYEWYDAAQKWGLRFSIRADARGPDLLSRSEWFAVVDDIYPLGAVKIHPAADGGITSTYPHQNLNTANTDGLPWRDGDICLAGPLRQYGGGDSTQEPYASETRLLWSIGRLKNWIEDAAAGTLSRPEEAFELPPFPGSREPARLVYSEDGDTFASWVACKKRHGACEVLAAEHSKDLFAVKCWLTPTGNIVHKVDWGTALREIDDPPSVYWLMLDSVPVHQDWAPPVTWGEMRAAFSLQGLDFDSTLQPIVAATQGRGSALLLVGFPIPLRFGESNSEIAWLCIRLPKSKGKIPDGFRPNPLGYWMSYMRHLAAPESIDWVPSANWHQSRLGARGQFGPALRATSITVVGLGALGCSVAELLARGGVRRLTLIDGDRLEVGNLARHLLGLSSVGKKKATAMAALVASINPFVEVEAITKELGAGDEAALTAVLRADCVIDCTGDDMAFRALARIGSEADGLLWLSASLGHGADSMYVFASPPGLFDFASFLEVGDEWLTIQERSLADRGVIFEGAGCWHPAFPGRNDDIRLLGGALPRLIETLIESELSTCCGFIGRVEPGANGGIAVSVGPLEVE